MIRVLLIGIFLTGFALADDVGKTITELGAKKYAARQAAQERLIELGEADLEGVLQRSVQEYATTRDPEVRERLRAAMAELVEKNIYHRPRGFLGIRMQTMIVAQANVAPVLRIQVMNVTENTAAEKAGLKAGDVITGMDGKPLEMKNGIEHFSKYIREQKPGTVVRLQVNRGGKEQEIPVTLGQMPPDVEQQFFSDSQKDRFFEGWLQDQLSKLPASSVPKIDKPPRRR